MTDTSDGDAPPGGSSETESGGAGPAAPTPEAASEVAALREQVERLTGQLSKANDDAAKKRIAAREANEAQGQFREVAESLKSEVDELRAKLGEAESLRPDAEAYRAKRDDAATKVRERVEAGGLPDYLAPLVTGADPFAALDAIRAYDATTTQTPPPKATKTPESGAPAEDRPFDYASASREEKEAWAAKAMADHAPKNSWA